MNEWKIAYKNFMESKKKNSSRHQIFVVVIEQKYLQRRN